jgi:hypothetical protein
MATATSSRCTSSARRAIWPAAAALVALAGYVALSGGHRSAGGHASPATPAATAFSWLRAAAAPSGWSVGFTRSGARLAYPPGWHLIQTDPGTASAAPAGPRGSFAGYLNATPRSGDETLANWHRFRVDHVAAEGARDVRLEAAATGLRFRSGRGSCVIDSYLTTKARFREIACIVANEHSTNVVVAAARTNLWTRQAPLLERAVASFAT